MASRPRVVPALAALIACFALAGCSDGDASSPPSAAVLEAASVAGPTTTGPSATPTVTVPAAAVAEPPATTTTNAPAPRAVAEGVAGVPFASVAGVTLVHPAARVERIGFHESNHDGARGLEPAPSAVAALTLEPRERGTDPRSAADVVVDPAGEIRAPVTGTVKRAGRYVLYCKHTDHFVVIAPDAQPAWEVKVLHVAGLHVARGQRVVAGETVIAPGPTILPFASQVDDHTADPAWPHVHIEVVDPSVRDRPSPGGGC